MLSGRQVLDVGPCVDAMAAQQAPYDEQPDVEPAAGQSSLQLGQATADPQHARRRIPSDFVMHEIQQRRFEPRVFFR